jgi:hypothetical protein
MSADTDIHVVHRRGWRKCGCGQRHSRNHLLYLRDQGRTVETADGERARVAGWATHRVGVTRRAEQ